jgi:hypothetical protein
MIESRVKQKKAHRFGADLAKSAIGVSILEMPLVNENSTKIITEMDWKILIRYSVDYFNYHITKRCAPSAFFA